MEENYTKLEVPINQISFKILNATGCLLGCALMEYRTRSRADSPSTPTRKAAAPSVGLAAFKPDYLLFSSENHATSLPIVYRIWGFCFLCVLNLFIYCFILRHSSTGDFVFSLLKEVCWWRFSKWSSEQLPHHQVFPSPLNIDKLKEKKY